MGAGGSRVAADDAKTREARTTALNFVRPDVLGRAVTPGGGRCGVFNVVRPPRTKVLTIVAGVVAACVDHVREVVYDDLQS